MKIFFKVLLFIVLMGLGVYGMMFVKQKNTLSLPIQTAHGIVMYQVETALTREEQELGLMNRQHLAPQNGMIFVFDSPREAHMWMKNTFIPLDMVFFDRGGRVVRVHKRAIPHDETIIYSGRPVWGVLEINAGEADKFGIVVGATLNLKAIRK